MKTPKILSLFSPHRLIHTLSLITYSKHLIKYAPCTPHHLISAYPSLQNPNFVSIHNRHFCSAARPDQMETTEIESATYDMLEKKLKAIGIDLVNCKIGEKNRLICPECEGGDSMERSFSLYITPDANLAMWQCYRAKCGWRGHVRAFEDVKAGFNKFDENANVKRTRIITEESIGLEPLCSKLVAFFAERKISRETLRRNGVMQKAGSEQVIAFTYRRNGVLVSCKYRDMHRKFWKEKKTEKILYGVDDIKDTVDIIIVEGEMDKLSMEEAGFPNCVSVPGGPPCKDLKETPSEEKDTEFQYLWNCKEYLGKASRIILATDADQPGQALAEELARQLGRERLVLSASVLDVGSQLIVIHQLIGRDGISTVRFM